MILNLKMLDTAQQSSQSLKALLCGLEMKKEPRMLIAGLLKKAKKSFK